MLELQGEAFGTMRQTYGGDTLNTAVYLARCGARDGLRVDYATALGDDALSAGMLQRWAAELRTPRESLRRHIKHHGLLRD